MKAGYAFNLVTAKKRHYTLNRASPGRVPTDQQHKSIGFPLREEIFKYEGVEWGDSHMR